ncbi:MAG: hypothetical protein Kow00121_60080 [Elainellaceae cyanobacterium]
MLNQAAQFVLQNWVLLQLCQERRLEGWQHLVIGRSALEGDHHLLELLKQPHLLEVSELAAKLPVELLGWVYEQGLRMGQSTAFKAGGVYYSPALVVDFMVQQTVGRLLEERSPAAILTGRESLRILDPACGAGAFLLGAYRYLLKWYHRQYLAAINLYSQQLYESACGSWHLTYQAKREILRRHIYGVDIDPQAVEITKQTLVLQLWDRAEPDTSPRSFGESLQDVGLETNICCGNALVGSDYQPEYDPADLQVGDDRAPIKPLDWHITFPAIIQAGGFEVVIGNPPWVFTRDAHFSDRLKRYYWTKYLANIETSQRGKAKQTGKVNLFTLFLLQFVHLLNPQGRAGIIVPNTLLRSTVYDVARKYLLDWCSIEQIIDLDRDTFLGVTAAPTVLILGKNLAHTTVKYWAGLANHQAAKQLTKQSFLHNTSYVFSVRLDEAQSALFQKLDSCALPLGQLTQTIIEGIVCRKDQVADRFIDSRYRKLLEGKDIQRYAIDFRQRYLLFDRQRLHRPRPDYVWNAREKIILRRIGGGNASLVAVLDTDRYCTFASTNNILLHKDCAYNLRYILALLNSKLLNAYYTQKFTNQSKLTVNVSKTFIEQLPIRNLCLQDPHDRTQHDCLIQLVEEMQRLHQIVRSTAALNEREILRQIQATDQKIDRLVYELYDLNDAEIALIERIL